MSLFNIILEENIYGSFRWNGLISSRCSSSNEWSVCLIEKIKEYREFIPAQDGEYSNRGSYAMPYSRTYDHGSYRRMYDNGSYDRGYYDDHRYSRHSIKDRMVSKLESMYDEAKTDHERQIVDEWIRRIGSES